MARRWLTDPSPELAATLPADLPPTPQAPPDEAVAAVRVADNGEPLLELPDTLASRHGYRELPLTLTPETIMLREGTIERLERAQAALPDGMRLLILDGWRSPAFQGELLAHYRRETARDLDGFVSDPDHPRFIAPHTTGAAVDLTIIAGDTALAMGTDWDSFSPESALRFLERPGAAATPELRLARNLRRLLADAMVSAGFGPLPTEWWHWSYGDQRWAAFHGRSETLYAPIEVAD